MTGPRCIHEFTYKIRTGFSYYPNPEQDILFVINDTITLEDIGFLQFFSSYFGLKPNFYDICMHGTLSLMTPLPHLETPLIKDFANKTIVIFDNEFAVTTGS
jgi:hypothetical protein